MTKIALTGHSAIQYMVTAIVVMHIIINSTYYYQQVAQLSQRNRAAGWISYGQNWKTGTGRQYLRTL